jgi:hypothetical protein
MHKTGQGVVMGMVLGMICKAGFVSGMVLVLIAEFYLVDRFYFE